MRPLGELAPINVDDSLNGGVMPRAKRVKDFQPIENYGVIGNMRSIALVSVEGSIDFLCFPDFDSPTIFAALLDT